MKIKVLILTFIASVMASTSAHATPVTWTLQDVVFLDGTVATGSFVYDADLGLFSNILITTNPGDDLVLLGGNDAGVLDAFSIDGGIVGGEFIQLAFGELLTNAGGLISLVGTGATGFASFIAFCDVGGTPNAAFCPLTNVIGIETGFVSAGQVPLPAGFWFMGTAIAAFGAARKRKLSLRNKAA